MNDVEERAKIVSFARRGAKAILTGAIEREFTDGQWLLAQMAATTMELFADSVEAGEHNQ